MVEMDFIVLEDNIEYAIVDEIIVDDIKYLYLVNEEKTDVKLRKLDDDENLIEVIDQQEINKAMLEFMKKHRNDFAS